MTDGFRSAIIAALLGPSAVAELFGTATVALSYFRGHELAGKLLKDLGEEGSARLAMTPAQKLLEEMDFKGAGYRLHETEGRLQWLRMEVAAHLHRKWWLTAGLGAYVVGAATGLAAGLVALYAH